MPEKILPLPLFRLPFGRIIDLRRLQSLCRPGDGCHWTSCVADFAGRGDQFPLGDSTARGPEVLAQVAKNYAALVDAWAVVAARGLQ